MPLVLYQATISLRGPARLLAANLTVVAGNALGAPFDLLPADEAADVASAPITHTSESDNASYPMPMST